MKNQSHAFTSQAYASTYFFMYIAYAAWFLFLKGVLKDALGGKPKEKVDTPAEEKQVDKKEKVLNDQAGEAQKGVESTNNSDLSKIDEVAVSGSNDQDGIVEADVVESSMELKSSVIN